MRRKIQLLGSIAWYILMIWIVLTIWVDYSDNNYVATKGNKRAERRVVIVYNPDPIYNLDQQVCESIAEGLVEEGCFVKIFSLAAVSNQFMDYDCYVFCANTYNWAPDRKIQNYIFKHSDLKAKPVVAVTLGAGSTKMARKKLENLLQEKQSEILSSVEYWLMKPNDDQESKKSNVLIVKERAKILGSEVGKKINHLGR